ncbi:MAG TPA: DUF2092 domain-containing protein [Rhizomicrobium sp.]|jgi:hypothetical protein|nr:DUF2092 domain-containing protein [Rhizomicrobium sp.]
MTYAGKTAIFAIALLVAPPAYADDALHILKSMSDYVAAQKTISASYDSSIEVVTSELQKIAFTSSGKLLISRPDKIRMTRTGGYADVVMNFNGKTLSILGKNLNAYAETEMPGTLDNLVDRIRARTDAAIPGADLFSTNAYAGMTEDLTDAKHIGRGVINGVECDHLAFRTPDVDWQIWVQVGSTPIPRKYVITSKGVTGAPQYTIQINDWRTDVPVDANAFVFAPPKGATKVRADQMKQVDEVPPGQPSQGGKK